LTKSELETNFGKKNNVMQLKCYLTIFALFYWTESETDIDDIMISS